MAKQLVFIDDSGDPGFKASSSSHFVIACVIFDDNSVAEATAAAIKAFRGERSLSPVYEFKFNKTRKDIVSELLDRVSVFDFAIRAIVVDKSLIHSDWLRQRPDEFYSYAIKSVLEKCPQLNSASVRLDDHSGKAYRKKASVHLRREVNKDSRKAGKVKFLDSRTDVLIQLADLVAGSIMRSCQHEKTDRDKYIGIISDRIEDIWNFR